MKELLFIMGIDIVRIAGNGFNRSRKVSINYLAKAQAFKISS
jgi:hypothetical protein